MSMPIKEQSDRLLASTLLSFARRQRELSVIKRGLEGAHASACAEALEEAAQRIRRLADLEDLNAEA